MFFSPFSYYFFFFFSDSNSFSSIALLLLFGPFFHVGNYVVWTAKILEVMGMGVLIWMLEVLQKFGLSTTIE